jgi:hypothetical protein
MLNYIVIAAAAAMGFLGHGWIWILPLAILATVMALVFPPARLASIRARGAFGTVFLGALPIQAALVALAFVAGHYLNR